MILINLLPHREEKRRLRKQAFYIGLGLSAVAGLVLVALWYAVQQQMISSQQARNEFLKSEITKLDEQIKDVSTLKEEIEALKARQKAVEDLQTDRNLPVHLLNELVRQTPEGIFLKQIRQDGDSVMVSGVAQTNERVSEFLRHTAYNSQWLERPELQEIKAASVTLADSKNPKRLFEFSVKVGLKRPQAAGAAASGASAPASRASAPQVN
ncbi:MAG TPA: PilN domain-containing protein [Aquabacterium sp.]|uniref:PilN domain-containing protein n=1 Tax=Aquabacterium sp. TaxID=1872578 RepID=UPI002E35E6FF|nr:PilN domain-containing protein [Aquabacterium sp.]HEX5373297.1 PilN domain-containing protein [Aquabacterium sp.]